MFETKINKDHICKMYPKQKGQEDSIFYKQLTLSK